MLTMKHAHMTMLNAKLHKFARQRRPIKVPNTHAHVDAT